MPLNMDLLARADQAQLFVSLRCSIDCAPMGAFHDLNIKTAWLKPMP